MAKKGKSKTVMIVICVLMVVVLAAVVYWFQHKTVVIGSYTVVYYKNRCHVDPETTYGSLESLQAIPCLIRINWQESMSSDMLQEYCYRPGRGVEKTRLIHRNN
ncbi:MAG TPA: hypothetical protein PLB14_03655 [Smithellaceae bacterium]|jgi:flagellar basal body-associated protein FliL|nr:hypothetical protein [Syntrophaceae bacterium]HPV48777.1 hypothetical protein [Smithellaceae bacterium]